MTDKPKPQPMTEQEKAEVRDELRRLFEDLDEVEREWAALPQHVRDANPQIGRWLADKPRTIN